MFGLSPLLPIPLGLLGFLGGTVVKTAVSAGVSDVFRPDDDEDEFDKRLILLGVATGVTMLGLALVLKGKK